MKRLPVLPFCLAVLVFMLGVSSCGDDDPVVPTEKTCDLSTNEKFLAGSVVYEATQGGDGTFSTITYVDDQGTQMISNPQLPWAKMVTVLNGTTVKLTATGTTTNGSLAISVEGTLTLGGTYMAEKSCSQSQSTAY